MKTRLKPYYSYLVLLLFCFALSACGSGSSSPPSRTTKTKTSLKTAGLVPQGVLVATLDVTISIPYGVTVAMKPGVTPQVPEDGVLAFVGTTDPAMILKTLDYIAPTPSANGSVRISCVAADGFTPSDYITITLDIASGFFPVASEFSVPKFEIGTMSYSTDASGNKTLNIYPIVPVPNPNSLLTVTVI